MFSLEGFFFPKLVKAQGDGILNATPLELEGDPLTPLTVLNDDALFQVFVLGTRGAGKTVFLASLFHLLSTQDGENNNFVLRCKDTKNFNQLRNTFKQIKNPAADWPAGTFASQEYIFDCEHHIKERKVINLFKFRYFDFPGGFITEGKSEEEINFVQGQVKNAHSVLVLLDGAKVRNLLDNRLPAGEPTIYDDLDMMVGLLQQCIGKPFHFAVTKSDILDEKVHTLDAIRSVLLQHKGFHNLIVQQRKSYPVHLMPVSAVGANFADYDPSRQEMIKRANGRVEPQFVDLSLTLTLVDYLTMISDAINKQFPDQTESAVVRNWVWKKIRAAAPLLGVSAGPLSAPLLSAISLSHPVLTVLVSVAATVGLQKIMEAGGTKLQQTVDQLAKNTDEAFSKITDRQSAVDAILKNQVFRALKFREQYPGSYFASDQRLA
jgi:Double-GTPase 2